MPAPTHPPSWESPHLHNLAPGRTSAYTISLAGKPPPTQPPSWENLHLRNLPPGETSTYQYPAWQNLHQPAGHQNDIRMTSRCGRSLHCGTETNGGHFLRASPHKPRFQQCASTTPSLMKDAFLRLELVLKNKRLIFSTQSDLRRIVTFIILEVFRIIMILVFSYSD